MKKGKKPGVAADIFIILIIVALYALTLGENTAEKAAVLASSGVYRGQAEDAVALEIAVSWQAEAVPAMLDALKKLDVRVTFAVSGQYAEAEPETVARMAADGHELAAMGYDMDFDGSGRALRRDITASVAAIERASCAKVALYYSGDRDGVASSRAAKRLGLKHVICTLDLCCARGAASDIIKRGLNEPHAGSIILMQPTPAGAEALAGLIEGLFAKGLRVTTVSAVLRPT